MSNERGERGKERKNPVVVGVACLRERNNFEGERERTSREGWRGGSEAYSFVFF